MISIYLIAYNEEVILSHVIEFYNGRFPSCPITVYDNFSTDRTRQIALSYGCEVVDFYTGGKLSDQAFIDIKNNCWKSATTDWVIIADCDEWLNIDCNYLKNTAASIIQSKWCNMVNLKDNLDVRSIDHGVIYNQFKGKCLCFNRTRIKEINYQYGCHDCYPVGDVVFSSDTPLLLHYKYINLQYLINRYKEYASRLSDHNKKHGLSFHYKFSARKIKREFNWHLRNAKLIPRKII